ncbi:glycosyltransferase family 2 protein [Thioalkalivibrio sp. HK1]|uniref:glycosyltransferase family 2 protein n=1 Tax=Thioalkalivibrio sp. HK1 TaxID=1469245 RepID=UPI0004725C2B|nr:glycosyltransferase family 2 protein [Thioalkalivibrio sp. HK1]
MISKAVSSLDPSAPAESACASVSFVDIDDPEPADDISVVMVSYRTGPVLFSALDAVLAEGKPSGVREIILVDNGNPPAITASLSMRAKRDPRLRLISGHGNVGFAHGCNIGARQATGRYLLLLNPDCCLEPGAVSTLRAEAANMKKRGYRDWMFGCRVLNPDGSEQRASRRALLTPRTALVEAFRLDRLLPRLFRDHRLNLHESPLPLDTARVFAVSGACMMLPLSTWRSIGGMDAGYFLHVDDLDLCFRLHRAGVPVYFLPHIRAIHRASSSRISPLAVEWHKTRGFFRYFRLHFCTPRGFLMLGPVGAGILLRFIFKAASMFFHRPSDLRRSRRHAM